jgi:hypothetical protein
MKGSEPMTDNDVFARFIMREELLRNKEHALLRALSECSLDAHKTGYMRLESLAAFDLALAELRNWLDDLSEDIHDEPVLDEHAD